jgi:hypothetical protein
MNNKNSKLINRKILLKSSNSKTEDFLFHEKCSVWKKDMCAEFTGFKYAFFTGS